MSDPLHDYMFGSPIQSPAVEAVIAANHPAPDAGGPCATCFFRPGTQANRTSYTTALVRFCVEGFRTFYCHEHDRLCRGFVAALNLRGVPQDEDDRRRCDAARFCADLLGEMIADAKAEQGSR